MTTSLVLHGFLGASEAFATVLSVPHQALRLPFHGQQEPALRCDDWEGALDALERQLPPGELILIGYSLGARLALGLSFRVRARLRGLIAISGHAGLPPAERPARRGFELELAERLEGARDMAEFLTHWERLPLFESQVTLPPAVAAAQRRDRLAHEPSLVSGAFRVLGQSQMPHYEPRLPELGVPSLWVAGELDTRYLELATRYASAAGGQLAGIAGAGHNPLLEAPSALAALMSSTLHSWSAR